MPVTTLNHPSSGVGSLSRAQLKDLAATSNGAVAKLSGKVQTSLLITVPTANPNRLVRNCESGDACPMSNLCRLIWYALVGWFQSRASLEAENLALCHQLNILRRRSPKKLTLSNIDFAGLYRWERGVLDALTIIKAGDADPLASRRLALVLAVPSENLIRKSVWTIPGSNSLFLRSNSQFLFKNSLFRVREIIACLSRDPA